MKDPHLFEPWFRGQTWNGWRTVLKGAFALPMTDSEIEFFRAVADRDPPSRRVREAWFIVGRRGGKDSIASLVAAYAGAMFNQQDRLQPGERALVACLANDKDQARIVLDYTRAYFAESPLLRQLVQKDERANDFQLANRVDIAVLTSNFRSAAAHNGTRCFGWEHIQTLPIDLLWADHKTKDDPDVQPEPE